MIKHGLLICSFEAKKKYSSGDKDLYKLNSPIESTVHGQFLNIFAIMEAFIDNFKEYHNDEKVMKMFSIDKSSVITESKDTYTFLSCIIMSGAYGYESEMTNKDTFEVVYTRKKEDADIKPFQMLMYVPHDTIDKSVIKGMLIFETIGSYGVKTITVQNMKMFFSDVCGLTLITRSISVRLFVERLFQEGKLSRITLVNNKVSADPSDNIFLNSGREEKAYFKPRLTNTFINKVLNFIGGSIQGDEILEINDTTYDDIKFTFLHAGRTKTVSLMALDSFSIIEDIPEHIYPNGDVNRENLIIHMEQVAKEYASKMIFYIE